VKKILVIFLLFNVLFIAAQTRQVQHYTYTEDNSNIGSDVCYNWNQLPNGELFVSNNDGLSSFDGKYFRKFNHEGRGKAISSSMYDPNGTLWCNSFHGDIYYLENEELIRHPISEKIKEWTIFYRIGDDFFLRTETTIYVIDIDTKKFTKIEDFKIILSVFEYKGNPFLIGSSFSKGMVYDLKTKEKKELDLPKDLFQNFRGFGMETDQFIYFENVKKLLLIDDFMEGNYNNAISIDYEGKINHIMRIGDVVGVSGMNGTVIYSLNGKRIQHILKNYQVTRFGQDQEGNFLATTAGNGLVLIPHLNVFRFNYAKYLDNERIITTIRTNETTLIHGTNAGKIIIHNLNNDQTRVLNLGIRSEVLSFAIHENKQTLYAYCDALFEVNLNDLSFVRKERFTSIKNMALFGNDFILGSRKGLTIKKKDTLFRKRTPGWNLSLIYDSINEHFTFSTKKGLFTYDPVQDIVEEVKIPNLKTDWNILDLHYQEDELTYLQDFRNIYRSNRNFSTLELLYSHPVKHVNGVSRVKDEFLVFLKDSLLILNKDGENERILTNFQGLNESQTNVGFLLDLNKYILVHGTSLTIFEGLPDQSSVAPNLAYRFNTKSTFQKKGDLFESDYDQNSLILDLKILKSLRSQGEANVYYRIKKSQTKWRKLNDPYGTILIERLPIGTDNLELYVQNEIGIKSPVYRIPFRVLPPFYLTTWFIVLSAIILILFIILIVLWRVRVTQKKSIEKLRKKQLEARALTAELTAIRSQMNPHFIFNVLTAIQAKVIQGKTDEAYQNIGDFAELIRNVLEKSGREFIFLKEEIALMNNYVELENSRLPSPIAFDIELEDPDYFDEVLIPTLITQPIIENAIKHAFPSDKTNKQIVLKANRNANGFTIQIIDNGVGMDATQVKQKKHQSFALEAMKKRLLTLSEHGSFLIDITFESTKNGTCVTFTFNYK
jgi:hypothetical protein